MGLFQRISDIISANLGELAEQYEDPETMLKQAIREMEESIEKATQDTAKTLASQKRLERELAHNESEAKQWKARAEQAVEAGDDELARKALSRKREHDKLAVALRDQLSAVKDAGTTLRRQLDGMKAKLAEAKRTRAALSARQKAADVRRKAYLATDAVGEVGLDDAAFKKFDRLKEKVEMAEAEAEALAELRGIDTAESEIPLNSGSSESDIEDELAALKGKRK
jgi:phage shock protein A